MNPADNYRIVRSIFLTGIALLIYLFPEHGLTQQTIIKNGFNLSNSIVSADKIISGGVPRDGIPAITKPRLITAEQAGFLEPDDRVIGVYRNGTTKAYPTKILNWHEIVNDTIGGRNIVVTYCPLCNSGIVFATPGASSRMYFGVSGLLFNNDVLLYDVETESLWSQVLGQSISGDYRGQSLEMIPAAHTTWSDWKSRYPNTLVLSRDTGYSRDYSKNPYLAYSQNQSVMFDLAHESSQYEKKELVLGLRYNGKQRAYPFTELKAVGNSRIDDEFAGEKLTIEWHERDNYARVLDQDGNEIPSVITYWFAWYAFFPDTSIFAKKETR